jgi:hypothetical protein
LSVMVAMRSETSRRTTESDMSPYWHAIGKLWKWEMICCRDRIVK